MKGLLLDFGGVLTTNVFDSFRAFSEAEGLAPDTVKRVFSEDSEARSLLRRLERGELTEEEFSPLFAARLGVADPTDLVGRLFATMEADEAMLAAVRVARRFGIRTGLISNSWGAAPYDRGAFPELFDGVVISGEVGLNKPEPEIFELGAERISLSPIDCVFVDDLRENCRGAEQVGMTAILHRGAATTLPELERLLGVTLT